MAQWNKVRWAEGSGLMYRVCVLVQAWSVRRRSGGAARLDVARDGPDKVQGLVGLGQGTECGARLELMGWEETGRGGLAIGLGPGEGSAG